MIAGASIVIRNGERDQFIVSGPDVVEGNQGYQIDRAEVKAQLILPLTKYIKAYGWDKWYSPAETEPSSFAAIRPSRPTRNVHGSVGRCHSRIQRL